MEKGKQVMGNEVSGKEGLYPVKPYQRGEGLPYAPVDWPNPGDTWSWKVGGRTTLSGFYQDRYTYPPKRLCGNDPNTFFASKPSLERYISSQFPNADVDKFFASFSWKVPTTRPHCSEDHFPQAPLHKIASKRRKEPCSNSERMKKARLAMPQAFPRRRTRQSYKFPARANIRGDKSVIDLCSLTDDNTSDESGYSESSFESPNDLEDIGLDQDKLPNDLEDVGLDQNIGPSSSACNASKLPDTPKVKKFHAQSCEDNVDNCLKSLEHLLSQHNDQAQVQTPLAPVGSDVAEEMSTYRKKLSSILALDFSCWLSSKNLKEISFLVEKLAMDPALTINQLLKLESIEEIPKAGKVFLQAEGIAEQANKFFRDIQAMKDKLSSMRGEFSELKKGEAEVQSQVDSKSLLVQEIDEQIVQLQSRRAELARDLESKKEVKLQVVAEKKIMEKSILAVIQEIHKVIDEIPKWEMSKKNAKKQMDEILARYAPFKGFSFEEPGVSCAPSAVPYVASSATQVPSHSASPPVSAPPYDAVPTGHPLTDPAYPSYPPYPAAYPPSPHFPHPSSACPPPAYPLPSAQSLPPTSPPPGPPDNLVKKQDSRHPSITKSWSLWSSVWNKMLYCWGREQEEKYALARGHIETVIFDALKLEWSVAFASPPSSIATNKTEDLLLKKPLDHFLGEGHLLKVWLLN
ncbi:hypothetical protein BT93_G0173 [Corymbia citriodora subsp. variegata]|nr:hypothetical protein BT93_G0173 [Corymbia citriodora subsp. variegata]